MAVLASLPLGRPPDRRGPAGPDLRTGLVDAVSYLRLGRVFVANMTGNVVFLGFCADPHSGLSAAASVIAIAGFLAGALAGGRAAHRLAAAHPGRWLAHLRGGSAHPRPGRRADRCGVLPFAGDGRFATIAVLAVALGVQNSTVRHLGAPDLTTTVLTLTLTGLAADSTLAAARGRSRTGGWARSPPCWPAPRPARGFCSFPGRGPRHRRRPGGRRLGLLPERRPDPGPPGTHPGPRPRAGLRRPPVTAEHSGAWPPGGPGPGLLRKFRVVLVRFPAPGQNRRMTHRRARTVLAFLLGIPLTVAMTAAATAPQAGPPRRVPPTSRRRRAAG